MIPKIIHYCWFGNNAYPENIKNCMLSWGKILKDYQIRRWDESNFDVHYNKYTKQAYNAKKYAFVSDYARLWALYNYGGVYMDCDVMVLKPLDGFLRHGFFSSCENRREPQYIVTATMGARKGHPFVKALLDD